MGKNKSLFRDEQYFLESRARVVRFNDDMDLDLFPLYHSRTKARALYRFFDGNSLYKEVINDPMEYHQLCDMFDICEPDDFLPGALSGVGMAEDSIVRNRCNFKFEVGFTEDGYLHVAPCRFEDQYSEIDDRKEKLYPNRAYTNDVRRIISNRAFSALALKFLEAANVVPEDGEFVVVTAALINHLHGATEDLPVHKDAGNICIGTTLIKGIALEGAKSGVYVEDGGEWDHLITSTARKVASFGRKETVGCIDSFELQNPLDMLVINNTRAFHDISRFSCRQRQVCVFSTAGGVHRLDYQPYAHHHPY